MENNVVSNIRVYTNSNLTALESEVNSIINDPSLSDRCEVEFSTRNRRGDIDFVVTVKIAPSIDTYGTPANVRGVSLIKFFTSRSASVLATNLSNYVVANPLSGSGYGIPQVRPYKDRETRYYAAMLPTISNLGGTFEKISEVDDSIPGHYDPLATDETIRVSITSALTNFAIVLPTVALSVGRKLNIMLAASAGAQLEIVRSGADTMVLPDATTTSTMNLVTPGSCATLECDGDHWYVRNSLSTKATNLVTRAVAVGGGGAYVIDSVSRDAILRVTTDAGGNVTIALPDPSLAANIGRVLMVTLAVKVVSNAEVTSALMINPAGALVAKCTLANAAATLESATFESDGINWYATSVTGVPTFA